MSLVSVEEALTLIRSSCDPMRAESVPLMQAGGRVLAQDMQAQRSQPPFAVSAMDGFALIARETPGSFTLIGESAAGHPFGGRISTGEAVRIHTGAHVPDGADVIAPLEITQEADNIIKISDSLPPQKYIRPRGLDFRQDDMLLKTGQRLTPAALALAAAMDLPHLPVRQKPRIALLASGDELVRPGNLSQKNESAGKIISANVFGLAALLRRYGVEIVDLGEAGDSMEALRDALAQVENVDVLITSGGVSVGGRDLIRAALEEKGFEAIFHGVAMRPGKPLLFGKMDSCLVLGLPGNPVSALVCAYVFALPCLAGLLGTEAENRMMEAITDSDLSANDDRQDYLRAKLTMKNNIWHGEIFPQQDSAMLYNFSLSQGLIVRPPLAPAVSKGSPVPLFRLN